MLSVDTIARVILNVVRSAAQPTSWDTGLLLVKDSNYSATKRLKSYPRFSTAYACRAATVRVPLALWLRRSQRSI